MKKEAADTSKPSLSLSHTHSNMDGPLFLISGPCVIENEDTTFKVAHFLKGIAQSTNIPVIFKSSYDKANRTSISSYRGPGLTRGLEILKEVKAATGLPILSDIHQVSEIENKTHLPINIKKGQFLSPWDMEQVVLKASSGGNNNILLTERGTCFGYNSLIADMRSISQREFVAPLSKAAIAAGADGIFLEIHPDPDSALSDGPNSLAFGHLESLLMVLKKIHQIVREKPTEAHPGK